MLEINNIHTYYGESYILQGLSLQLDEGCVVGLCGRNGAGKTTVIRSIMSFNPPRKGDIFFKKNRITNLPPYKIVQMGIGLVPQGRHIFSSLSVEENLKIAERHLKKPGEWTISKVYFNFPILKSRSKYKSNLLSGGEQQMLAIGCALMLNPDLILLDEPSEGLAPIIVRQIAQIIVQLKSDGISVLLVEQNVGLALLVSDNIYIMDRGVIIHESPTEMLKEDKALQARYLGVTV